MDIIQSTMPELYELLDLKDFAQVENMEAPPCFFWLADTLQCFLTKEITTVFVVEDNLLISIGRSSCRFIGLATSWKLVRHHGLNHIWWRPWPLISLEHISMVYTTPREPKISKKRTVCDMSTYQILAWRILLGVKAMVIGSDTRGCP